MSAHADVVGNLGDDVQSRRLRVSVIAAGVALVVAVATVKLGVSPAWRTLLFLPFMFASIGVNSSLFRVCSFMAARGERNFGDGAERIADPEELRAIRRLGRRVLAISVVTALVATSLFIAAP